MFDSYSLHVGYVLILFDDAQQTPVQNQPVVTLTPASSRVRALPITSVCLELCDYCVRHGHVSDGLPPPPPW